MSSRISSGSRFFILVASVSREESFELCVDRHQDSPDPTKQLDDVVERRAPLTSRWHSKMVALLGRGFRMSVAVAAFEDGVRTGK
jgi:hypothetical protein